MNVVMKLLKLIPIKILVSNLPRILAFLLTKVMQSLAKNNPTKLKEVIEVSKKVVHAMEVTLEAGEDNVFEPKEIEEIASAWKEAF